MERSDTQRSYLGSFWLPSQNENTSLPGVLDLNITGGSVRLQGALTSNGLLNNAIVFAKLLGRREQATLFNCFASASRKADGTGVSSTIDSTRIALGTLCSDLGGYAIQFRLPGSSPWFHEQSFDVDVRDLRDMTVRLKAFDVVEYPLSNELTLERLHRSAITSGDFGAEELHVLRPMVFRIRSRTRIEFDRLWAAMFQLRRFLEFLSQNHLPHAELALFDEADASRNRPDIEIHQSTLYAVKPSRFEWDDQLLAFEKIRDRFPELLLRWFEVYHHHPYLLYRYFAAFDRDRSDQVLHFLWNFVTLEEIHKLRTARSKQGLHSLQRLLDIRERWASAFDVLPSDEVLKRIRDNRNYYAHNDSTHENEAARDWELLRYGDFLAALSNLEILALLGIEDDEIINLTNSYWMRETLALNKYPT